MKNITIIGAGLAGLLAGNMLRRHPVQIVEAQPTLPNNHHAVLRFRTERVSEQVHVPFRKVRVFKTCDESDPIRAAMMYSRKVTGRYEVRSLIDLSPCDRFIAPLDFINQVGSDLDIAYGIDGLAYCVPDRREEVGPVVSTLPMPLLMDFLEYEGPRPSFVQLSGFTITADLEGTDVHASRYYVHPGTRKYRASVTGSRLSIEHVGLPETSDVEDASQVVEETLHDFGFDRNVAVEGMAINTNRYAKLGALSESDRRKANEFMFWASTKLGIYSLGRFATWRSGLLLDSLVDDVLKIERWIGGSNYELKKETGR